VELKIEETPGSITDYIDGSGNIIWGVYETRSSEDMRINYLEMVVHHE